MNCWLQIKIMGLPVFKYGNFLLLIVSMLVLFALTFTLAFVYLKPTIEFNANLEKTICQYQGYEIRSKICTVNALASDCFAGFQLLSYEPDDAQENLNGTIRITDYFSSRLLAIRETQSIIGDLLQGDPVVCFLTPEKEFAHPLNETRFVLGVALFGSFCLVFLLMAIYEFLKAMSKPLNKHIEVEE